ncbi:LysR family transcriptional regulator [Burkholderiaceae bacterium DAT-1]|nr:LysR family transcriptional regulator [Burkholderiaceae bacterium DAT-1]
MPFSWRHVEIFRAVMSSGSTTDAAAMLHTSQPTISRELSRFEKLTGLKLFERIGGRLQPTEAGLMLFEEVQRSFVGLDRIGTAADSIRHFQHGKISVACLPAFAVALLPRVWQRFQVDHPGVSISITPLETPLLQESLSSQRFHLGLTEDALAPAGTISEAVFTHDQVCVLPPGHALCEHAVLTPAHFAGENVVSLAPTDPYRVRVDQLFAERGITRRMAAETVSAASVCALVLHGAGIAIVNPLTALDYHAQGLAIRRFSESIPFSVYGVRPLHRPASELADRFFWGVRVACGEMNEYLINTLI